MNDEQNKNQFTYMERATAMTITVAASNNCCILFFFFCCFIFLIIKCMNRFQLNRSLCHVNAMKCYGAIMNRTTLFAHKTGLLTSTLTFCLNSFNFSLSSFHLHIAHSLYFQMWHFQYGSRKIANHTAPTINVLSKVKEESEKKYERK